MNRSTLLLIPLVGVLGMTCGCEWMDAYPGYGHTTAADYHKGGSGSYGGTNTADINSMNAATGAPGTGNTSDLPGSGTSDAAGSGVTNNSMTNFTGNSSETTGVGSTGTSTYSGSSAGGSDAGSTNNNGTTGPVSSGTK